MAALIQKERSGDSVQAVSLALQVLEILAFGGRPRRVTELAEVLGTSKTRVFRHLRTLTTLGYVVQDPVTDRYAVGVRLAELGGAVARQLDLLGVSEQPMRKLRDALGFAVVLSKVDREEVYVIGQIDGTSWLTISIVIGTRLSLHGSAQGKLVLAFGPDNLLEEVLRGKLQPLTRHTIVDPERLRCEIEAVRQRGWATAPGESVTGINTLAMPLFGRGRRLVATVGLLGSVDALPVKPTAVMLELLRAATDQINEKLTERG